MLSDSKTGYVYYWRLYTGRYKVIHKIDVVLGCKYCKCIVHSVQCDSIGKDDSLTTESSGLTYAMVLKLLESLEHHGRHVYTNNYYSSPALFTELHNKGFGSCGTVRIDRRGVAHEMRQPLSRGEVVTASLSESLVALK